MKVRHLILILSIVICEAALAQSADAQGAGAQPLTNQNVIKLLKEDKLTVEQVKEKLKGTASNFDFSETGIKQLQDAGADASMLAAMIQSPRFKGNWYVADLYEYLDAIQLSGTNYVPSLFSPIAPGVVYVILLALLWLVFRWLADETKRRRAKILGAVIIVFLLVSGAVIGSTNLLRRFYAAVSVSEVSLGFIAKPISPDQIPCDQIARRRLISSVTVSSLTSGGSSNASGSVTSAQSTLDPLMKAPSVRESDSVPPSPAAQQTQAASVTQGCRQPETSAAPALTLVGKVISPEGNTGDVYLDKKSEGYVLAVKNVHRAGKYAGRVSSDVIAPAAFQLTLTVSDWWPYFFVAVALGILFTNIMIMPRLQPSLPHGEALGTNREVAEAFAQGVNSAPVATLSSLAAALIGLYASYSSAWGLTTDYVTAFLSGAAITLGLKTLAGAANAAATRLERAFKREPPHFVNEVHLQPPTDNK
jgi:hypothetical protein